MGTLRRRRWRFASLAKAFALLCLSACAFVAGAQGRKTTEADCRKVMFEGEVNAGAGFEKAFTSNLRFVLEPLRSGWIVRVLDRSGARGAHDDAELATPPYRSVSPLLISTDWSFRAQDAIAWNPRRFRYAADKAEFARLAGLYDGVMANDARSSAAVAGLLAAAPEGTLQILDARIAPGAADQARMASMVAGHLAQTPFVVDRGQSASPLGRLERLRFRVELDLAKTAVPADGVTVQKNHCKVPTTQARHASDIRQAANHAVPSGPD